MKKLLLSLMLCLVISAYLTGCGGQEAPTGRDPDLPPVMGDDITPTDYADPDHWLQIPETNYPVDVFYL